MGRRVLFFFFFNFWGFFLQREIHTLMTIRINLESNELCWDLVEGWFLILSIDIPLNELFWYDKNLFQDRYSVQLIAFYGSLHLGEKKTRVFTQLMTSSFVLGNVIFFIIKNKTTLSINKCKLFINPKHKYKLLYVRNKLQLQRIFLNLLIIYYP